VSILLLFGLTGFALYYDGNVNKEYHTRKQRRTALNAADKKYKAFRQIVQPKIVDVRVEMDIYPASRNFKAKGSYQLVNLSDQAIDTLVINYLAGNGVSYEMEKPNTIISADKIADIGHFDIVQLEQALQPGDSLQMNFACNPQNKERLPFGSLVKSNGTFIEDDVFPRLGNWLDYLRAEFEMGRRDDRPHPSDESAAYDSFMAKDADRVGFEAVVSTSGDQMAIAPGQLMKHWTDQGRNYYHYQMEEKIALSYLFMSGDYAVAKDRWQDVALEIYYDRKHPFNIEYMMQGLKDGLAYCSENFSPYQHDHLRIVEFSQVGGASAHGFPGTIPAGEGSGFIADVDTSAAGGINYAYGTAVHETAHEWWGHQVLPANTLGSKMIVESMAEYVNSMVKKHKIGEAEARKFQRINLSQYLSARGADRRGESPLMYTYPNQNYIHYPKGSIVFYMLAEYLGEDQLNAAIRNYVQKVAFQERKYTTSIEMVDSIRSAVPDSLQYLIKDWFETVTLYDNRMVEWTSTPLPDSRYELSIQFEVSKYRSEAYGTKRYSDNGRDSLQY
ncbi:MAG: M1 family aminopeptidase, partial [Bacteroidota bacterium]